MATEELQIHTCDRCESSRQQPFRQDFPRDWSRISQQQVQGGALDRWDLCAACSASFETWMKVR